MTVLPVFILSRWHLESLAVILPSILFFLWSPGLLLSQRPNLPMRTIALLGLLTVLTVIDFVFEWNYGVQYQGMHYTLAVDTMNLVWMVFLWWAIIQFWRKPSFAGNLLSHWLLLVGLAWYAFPYLGELP
jgi:hypothetical protein